MTTNVLDNERGVQNEPARIDSALQPLIRYACEFWASHLVEISPVDFEQVKPKLREFAELQEFADSRFLHLFDPTSQLDLIDAALASVQIAVTWMVRFSTCFSAHTLTLIRTRTTSAKRYRIHFGLNINQFSTSNLVW